MWVTEVVFLSEDRTLLVLPPDARIEGQGTEFQVLYAGDVASVGDLARRLLPLGCSGFICVGVDSEQVHDAIDDIIVGEEHLLGVITTWHEDVEEGCWFFVHAVQATLLIALVDDPVVIAALRKARSA